MLEIGARRGIRLTFEDEGPGIPDVAAALTTAIPPAAVSGLGLGGASGSRTNSTSNPLSGREPR